MIFGAGFIKLSKSAGSKRGILYSRTNICFKVPLGICRKSSSFIIFPTIAPEFSRLKCIISFLLYFRANRRLIFCLPICLLQRKLVCVFLFVAEMEGEWPTKMPHIKKVLGLIPVLWPLPSPGYIRVLIYI